MAASNIKIARGDKVELYIENGPEYRTTIDDITDDGLCVMMLPSYRGIPLLAKRGDEMNMRYFRSNGKYQVDVKIRDIIIEGKVRLLLVEMLSEPLKNQEREHFRLPVSINAVIYHFPDGQVSEDNQPDLKSESIPVVMKDISVTGARLQIAEPLPIEDYVIISIRLHGVSAEPLFITAQIVRVIHDSVDNRLFLGVSFDMDYSTQQLINRYVVDEQRRQMKQRKMVKQNN